MNMSKILVTGASGQLGSLTIQHLLDTQGIAAADIVAATRDPAKLADLAAKGIEVRKADFDDAASLETAFAGIDRLAIISTDALAIPGQRQAQHKAAIAAAVKAGVKHVVYTSMPNPDKSRVTFAPDHLASEQAVKASGLAYTILRNAWYMDNYLMSLPHNLQTGQWFSASGDGKVSNISRDDCAKALAAVLAAQTTASAIYTLTSAESLTISEVAALVAGITGKPLSVVPVTDEQLAGGLTGAGLPPFLVDMLVSADANVRDGNFDLVTGDFHALTGSAPQTLNAFLAERKAVLAG
jgi:NAD(P)H dehydrogenase (quinone)